MTNGAGNGIRLKPNQVVALLPKRIGIPRMNTRTRDVHTASGTLSANDAQLLYLKLSSNAETWPKDQTADAVRLLAEQNQFDPVADYLNGISAEPLPMEQWQRLDLHLLGIDDPIAAEFLPRFFIGAVARVFSPGCDVRQSPVLVGPQWRGKTALGRILFGAENWISGVGDLGKDALMRLHTGWGIELAELDGVTRRSDQESLKAFLTETCDSIRRPYDAATVRHPRRFVFWGTSNGAALRDSTGNTRYVTIPIPDQMLPLDWSEQHRDALWLRAVQQYRAGIDWNRCSDDIRAAIADRNADFTEIDPWQDRIAQALERKALELQLPVTIADLLQVVEVPIERQRQTEGQRVRRIAESLGWQMERRRTASGKRRGLWPQRTQRGHNDGHNDEPSQANGSDPLATLATTNREKLGSRGAEQQQHAHEAQEKEDLGAIVVARVATPPEPSDGNGSQPSAVVANDVAVVASVVATPTWQTRAAELRATGMAWHTIALQLEQELSVRVTGRQVQQALG
jgi:predicted P-loop ATPase